METEIKLAKRLWVIVTESEKRQSSFSHDSNEWIYEYYQHFMLGRKHLKGSEHPQGWYATGYSSGAVNIRWLYTESNGFFAPELSFGGREMLSFKMIEKLHKAFNDLPRHGEGGGPEQLTARLKAVVVEYVEDAWRTYRPLRIPGESPLISLARAAD